MTLQAERKACAEGRGHKTWHVGAKGKSYQRRAQRVGRDSAQVAWAQVMQGAGTKSGLLPCLLTRGSQWERLRDAVVVSQTK